MSDQAGAHIEVLEGQLDVLDLVDEAQPAHVIPESVRRLWGIPAQHDLPPSWDGVPVTWGEWGTSDSSLAYHLPLDQLACTMCGSLAGVRINWGTRYDDEEGRQIRNLWVARCEDCGHDTVHDEGTDETWDLDPDDYGDEGSTETKDTLF